MVNLTEAKLQYLESAIKYLEVDKYLKLKGLFAKGDTTEFRDVFMRYYHLNIAHLSEEFKERYFSLLFSLDLANTSEPHPLILKKLFEYPSLNGRKSLQFSFVSKLVAMRDESFPIYDKHVREFFDLKFPNSITPECKIRKFMEQIDTIRNTYGHWENDRSFQTIISKTIKSEPKLSDCKAARIFDLLIWTAGHKKITKKFNT